MIKYVIEIKAKNKNAFGKHGEFCIIDLDRSFFVETVSHKSWCSYTKDCSAAIAYKNERNAKNTALIAKDDLIDSFNFEEDDFDVYVTSVKTFMHPLKTIKL